MLNFIIKQYKYSSNLDLTKERYLMNKFVLINLVMKFFTFLPAYYLNKLKISPDSITILSYFQIFISAILFYFGNESLGCLFMFLFLFFDSLDGDLARLKKFKSKHGQTMDVLGADLFYIIIPVAITFNLFKFQEVNYFFYDKNIILIIGFLISFFLIFHRILGLRNYILFSKFKSINKKKEKEKKKFSKIKNYLFFFDNEIIRGNFFSEPGFILNFSILILLDNFQLLYYYMLIIFLYLALRVFKLFVGTIIVYTKN